MSLTVGSDLNKRCGKGETKNGDKRKKKFRGIKKLGKSASCANIKAKQRDLTERCSLYAAAVVSSIR